MISGYTGPAPGPSRSLPHNRNLLTQYTGDYLLSCICEDDSNPSCQPKLQQLRQEEARARIQELLDGNPVGKLTDLPAEEEYQDEEGQKIRTVNDESGTLVKLRLGPDGSLLDLEIPPDTE